MRCCCSLPLPLLGEEEFWPASALGAWVWAGLDEVGPNGCREPMRGIRWWLGGREREREEGANASPLRRVSPWSRSLGCHHVFLNVTPCSTFALNIKEGRGRYDTVTERNRALCLPLIQPPLVDRISQRPSPASLFTDFVCPTLHFPTPNDREKED